MGLFDQPELTQPDWVERRKADVAAIIARYPRSRSAIMPLLHLAQDERGYVAPADIEAVAALLELPAPYVESTCSFYAMYHRHKVGRYVLLLCGNLSCTLSGASATLARLEAALGVRAGETTPDGLFTLEATTECLAACDGGPVMQVNVEYVLRVTPDKAEALVKALREQDRAALAALMEAGEAAADYLLNAPVRPWHQVQLAAGGKGGEV